MSKNTQGKPRVFFLFCRRQVKDYMTEKQKKFADEYLIDTNATQAAIRAGYSEKTAYSQGQRLLKNVEVSTYIEGQLDKISGENIADAKEVMEYLTSVMRGEAEDQVLRFIGDGYQEKTYLQVSTKDRTRAAELLGKRYGIFKDNLDLGGNLGVTIVDDLGE